MSIVRKVVRIFVQAAICISPCLGFRASSSTDLRVDPAQLAGDSGVHSRGVSLGTSVAPRDNTCDIIDIVMSPVSPDFY